MLTVRAALLAVALLLAVSTSHSRTAPPTPQKQQATSKNAKQDTGADKRGTKDSPLVIQLTNPGKSDAETAKEQQNIDRDFEQKRLAFEQQRLAFEQQRLAEERVFWLTVALIVATVLQFLALLFQWRQLKRTVDATNALVKASKEEFIATHRPRIRVRHLVCDIPEKIGYGLMVQSQTANQFTVVNVGASPARIIGAQCNALLDMLPMEVPHRGVIGNIQIDRVLQAGESEAINMPNDTFQEVAEAEPRFNIHISGWVDYLDDSKPPHRRRTAFCRRYENRQMRFVRVSDTDYADYEYED